MALRMMIAIILASLGVQALASKPIYLQTEILTGPTLQSTEMRSSRTLLVQSKERITEEFKKTLIKNGLSIISYIPEDTLLVRSKEPVSTTKVRDLPGVLDVHIFKNQWKLSSTVPKAHVFNAHQSKEFLVKTFEPMSIQKLIGGEVIQSSQDYHHISISVSEVQELIRNQSIQWVDLYPEIQSMVIDLKPTYGPHLNDYENITGYETGTRVMNFQQAWDRGLTGAGESVAMADTGLDRGIPGTLTPDFSSVRRGYKFGLFAKDWSDPMGHGTHVAGSVMSQGTASGGRFKGGAFDAEMIPQGLWSPVMKNMTVPPKLADMLAPAYADGARVHTNSWGSPKDLGKYHSYSRQVDQFMWDHPDMLIVFAAGNSGTDSNKDGRIDPGSVSFPGTAKNILTVGASENYLLEGGIQRKLGELRGGEPWGAEPIASDTLSNNKNGIAAFSSRGPTADGRLKPDVVAPGTNIVSNCSPVDGASPLWGNYNEHYCYSGGTSMSAPLAAGAAAVTRQFLMEKMFVANPSAALVKAVMLNSADNLFPGQFGSVGKSNGQELLVNGPNNHQGFGRVNMDQGTNPSRFLKLVDSEGVASGQSLRFDVTVPEGGDFKATLVYTDAPGAENAAKALVNDLDMKVILAGQEFLSDSRVDNMEQIRFGNLTGPATIEVIGQNIPMGKNGKQPFALVISR